MGISEEKLVELDLQGVALEEIDPQVVQDHNDVFDFSPECAQYKIYHAEDMAHKRASIRDEYKIVCMHGVLSINITRTT